MHPDSGAPGYGGVQDADNPDPFYYRPDVDPPRHPGLLAAAQRAFTAPGLRAPWYRRARQPRPARARARSRRRRDDPGGRDRARRLVEPDPHLEIPREEALAAATVQRLLRNGRLPGRTAGRPPPTAGRHELSAAAYVGRLRAAGAAPHGAAGPRRRRLRRRDAACARSCSTSRAAAAWTRARSRPARSRSWPGALRGAGDRWVVVFSHEPLRKVAGGAALLAQLDADPRVARSRRGRHATATASRPSHAARRLVGRHDQRPGRLPAAGARAACAGDRGRRRRPRDVDGRHGPVALADTARELAFLDAQGGRPAGDAGRAPTATCACTCRRRPGGEAAASRASDRPAEPVQRQAAAQEQEHDRPAREGRRDLAPLVLLADLGAQAPVDRVQRGRVAGVEGLAAGEARDLLQRHGSGGTARCSVPVRVRTVMVPSGVPSATV